MHYKTHKHVHRQKNITDIFTLVPACVCFFVVIHQGCRFGSTHIYISVCICLCANVLLRVAVCIFIHENAQTKFWWRRFAPNKHHNNSTVPTRTHVSLLLSIYFPHAKSGGRAIFGTFRSVFLRPCLCSKGQAKTEVGTYICIICLCVYIRLSLSRILYANGTT